LAVKGVKQLHSSGFTHRDLKPENIVVSLDPLDVKVIDFETVKLQSSKVAGSIVIGTPGYYPNKPNWKEGSTLFDVWALGAIILESNMKMDAYYDCGGEEDAKKRAKAHIKEGRTCKHLGGILRGTVLSERDENIISLEEIA
jgi:serine/threonine protein kinase